MFRVRLKCLTHEWGSIFFENESQKNGANTYLSNSMTRLWALAAPFHMPISPTCNRFRRLSFGILFRWCNNRTVRQFMLLLQYNIDDLTMPTIGQVTCPLRHILCAFGSYRLTFYVNLCHKLCIHSICVFHSRLSAVDGDVSDFCLAAVINVNKRKRNERTYRVCYTVSETLSSLQVRCFSIKHA